MMMRTKKIVWIPAIACLLALWIACPPAQAQEATRAPENTAAPAQAVKAPTDEDPDVSLVVARIYAKRFKGRKTSSGEIYDPAKLTAAHPTLPLGAEVKVVNPANNRTVVVTINDRCRKRKELYIDLSRQAARELGILRQGKAIVRIIPLEDDEDEDDGEDSSPEESDRLQR